MKKAVLVACCLSFCSVNVLGMPVDRRGDVKSPLLKECKCGLDANPSVKSERDNTHKRKLSRSGSDDGECGVQKRCERREDATDKQGLTDSERIVGLKKRIEKKEGEIERRELMVKTVDGVLDSLMEEGYKELTDVDPMFTDLYHSFDADVGKKAKFLVSAVVSAIKDTKSRVERLERDRNAAVEAFQDLRRENKSNKESMSELERKSKAEIDNLKGEIRKLSDRLEQFERIPQNRGNEDKQVVLNRGLEGQTMPVGGANTLPAQEMSGSHNGTRWLEDNAVQDVVMTENQAHEEQVVDSGRRNETVGAGEEIFENARLGVRIKGRFVDGYLDFSRPVGFKGCYVKNQEFVLSGSGSEKIKISREDLSNVKRMRESGGRLSLLSSKGESGIIFCKEFVYKGAVDGWGKPSGQGIMLRSTGEVREGCRSTDGWLGE